MMVQLEQVTDPMLDQAMTEVIEHTMVKQNSIMI